MPLRKLIYKKKDYENSINFQIIQNRLQITFKKKAPLLSPFRGGFRSNTAPLLIDTADFFIDLGDIAELVSKDASQSGEFEVPSFIPPDEMPFPEMMRNQGETPKPVNDDYANYEEEETRNEADLVRVTDEL